MAQKEQQRSRRKQRSQAQESSRTQVTQGCDAHSYISITHAKSEVDEDRYDPQWSQGAASEHGLPSYEVVVTRGRCPPPTKVPLEDTRCFAGSSSLQPNRRKECGEVELGAVLSVSEVDLVRARSKRGRNVNDMVYHWRSPIGALLCRTVVDVRADALV